MSEFANEEERDKYVLRLHRLSWTRRAIAQALELSLVTVSRIIETADKEKQRERAG